MLARLMLDNCKISQQRASFMVGKEEMRNGEVYLPIIYKNAVMNQEIKYSGFSAVPSDYECSDGSLAVSINLLPEDGALQPVLPPSVEVQLSKRNGQLRVYPRNIKFHTLHSGKWQRL